MTFPDSISLPYFLVKPALTTSDIRHPYLYVSTKSSNIFHHNSNIYLLYKVVRAKNYSSIVYLSLVAQMVKICLQCGRPGFHPWVGKILWRRERLTTPAFSPGESHGERNLLGYSPQGLKESDTTEWLTHTQSAFRSMTPVLEERLRGRARGRDKMNGLGV